MTLLHQRASQRTLEFITRLVFGLWLIKLAADALPRLSLLPPAVFDPVGFLGVMPSTLRRLILSGSFLWTVEIATVISLVLVLAKVARTAAALVACAGITLHLGIARSFAGNIGHQDLVLLYAAYWLALCPVADGFARRAHDRRLAAPQPSRPEIPLVGIVATLCCTYAFVGIFRLVQGGCDVFAPETLRFWALRNSYHVVHPTWGLGKLLLESPRLTNVLTWGFPIVTAFEVLAPLCLVSRRFRQLFLLVMVPFHLVSWLVLDLFFWENLALYVLFLDEPWLNRLTRLGHDVVDVRRWGIWKHPVPDPVVEGGAIRADGRIPMRPA